MLPRRYLKTLSGGLKKCFWIFFITQNHAELELESVEASTFLNETVLLVEPKAKKAGLDININIPENLGTIKIDSSAMSATLVNFLENAVDACDKPVEGRKHSIGFSASLKEKNLVIVISDTGIGMDQDTKNKIFTLFFSSKGKKGTGIGLFISNQTIEQTRRENRGRIRTRQWNRFHHYPAMHSLTTYFNQAAWNSKFLSLLCLKPFLASFKIFSILLSTQCKQRSLR